VTEDSYKPPCKGKLIVIDGIDCSGKTVQSAMLGSKSNTVVFSFPEYLNKTGQFISEMMEGGINFNSRTWSCMMAANRYEEYDLLVSALKHGDVICNRYYISNIAYSTASGIDTEWLFQLDSGMPKPNLVIILDVPVQVSLDRKKDRDIIERDLVYLEKVRKTYVSLGAQLGWRVINGDRPAEYVHEEILKIVNDEFGWKL